MPIQTFAYPQGPLAYAPTVEHPRTGTDWRFAVSPPRDIISSEQAQREQMWDRNQSTDDQARLHSYLYPGAPLQQVPGSQRYGDFTDRLL